MKNRLDEGYDAGATAGYRDVVLNLVIDTPETRRLGLETHVCEVQLALLCLAGLVTEESHGRYRRDIDLRARPLCARAYVRTCVRACARARVRAC